MRIPSLEDFPITTRIVVAILIIIAVMLFLFVVYALVEPDHASAEAAPAEPDRLKHTCVTDENARERLRAIMFESLDDALHDSFKKAFTVWMSDVRGQPERARVGVSQALRAHQIARQLAVDWTPPLCQQ